MRNKILGIFVFMLLITIIFPYVEASIDKIDEKENLTKYDSRIFGIGFVRIHPLTHTISGYVFFGINNGQIISGRPVIIIYTKANELFEYFLPSFVFYIRYNPA